MSRNQENVVVSSFGLIWFIIVISTVIGWIMNIFDVAGVTSPLNAEDVLHIVGIFIGPLGAIMGIFF